MEQLPSDLSPYASLDIQFQHEVNFKHKTDIVIVDKSGQAFQVNDANFLMIDVKRFTDKGEYSYYRYFRHVTRRGNFSEDTYRYAFN